MVRLLVAVILGIVGAFVCIVLVESASHWFWPLPTGLDFNDPAQLANFVGNMPIGALLALVFGWCVGAFVGSAISTRIAPIHKARAALSVFVVLALATCANFLMIPHPLWLLLAATGCLPAFAWLGWRIAR